MASVSEVIEHSFRTLINRVRIETSDSRVSLNTLLGTDNKFEKRESCRKKARGCTLSAVHNAAADSHERSVSRDTPGAVSRARIYNGCTGPWGSDRYDIMADATMDMLGDIIEHGITKFHFNGHSRGAVSCIFIANTLKQIQERMNKEPTVTSVQELFSGCNDKIKSILTQKFEAKYGKFCEDDSDALDRFRSLLDSIEINIFAIDPVPGDHYLDTLAGGSLDHLSWHDPEVFTIPDIVKNYYQIMSTHERSQCFSALAPTADTPSRTTVTIENLPGNHCNATGILTTQDPEHDTSTACTYTSNTDSNVKVQLTKPLKLKAESTDKDPKPIDTSAVQDLALCRMVHFMQKTSGITEYSPEKIDEKTTYHTEWQALNLRPLKEILSLYLSHKGSDADAARLKYIEAIYIAIGKSIRAYEEHIVKYTYSFKVVNGGRWLLYNSYAYPRYVVKRSPAGTPGVVSWEYLNVAFPDSIEHNGDYVNLQHLFLSLQSDIVGDQQLKQLLDTVMSSNGLSHDIAKLCDSTMKLVKYILPKSEDLVASVIITDPPSAGTSEPASREGRSKTRDNDTTAQRGKSRRRRGRAQSTFPEAAQTKVIQHKAQILHPALKTLVHLLVYGNKSLEEQELILTTLSGIRNHINGSTDQTILKPLLDQVRTVFDERIKFFENITSEDNFKQLMDECAKTDTQEQDIIRAVVNYKNIIHDLKQFRELLQAIKEKQITCDGVLTVEDRTISDSIPIIIANDLIRIDDGIKTINAAIERTESQIMTFYNTYRATINDVWTRGFLEVKMSDSSPARTTDSPEAHQLDVPAKAAAAASSDKRTTESPEVSTSPISGTPTSKQKEAEINAEQVNLQNEIPAAMACIKEISVTKNPDLHKKILQKEEEISQQQRARKELEQLREQVPALKLSAVTARKERDDAATDLTAATSGLKEAARAIQDAQANAQAAQETADTRARNAELSAAQSIEAAARHVIESEADGRQAIIQAASDFSIALQEARRISEQACLDAQSMYQEAVERATVLVVDAQIQAEQRVEQLEQVVRQYILTRDAAEARAQLIARTSLRTLKATQINRAREVLNRLDTRLFDAQRLMPNASTDDITYLDLSELWTRCNEISTEFEANQILYSIGIAGTATFGVIAILSVGAIGIGFLCIPGLGMYSVFTMVGVVATELSLVMCAASSTTAVVGSLWNSQLTSGKRQLGILEAVPEEAGVARDTAPATRS